MGLFDKQKLNIKFNIVISLWLVIILLVVGIILINFQEEQIEEETELKITEQINELSKIYSLLVENNQVKVNEALVLANELFLNFGKIYETLSNKIVMQAISPELVRKSIKVKKWYQKDTLIHFNTRFVDEMTKLSNVKASIYQKVPQGYICISTSVRDYKNDRVTGTLISNSSPMVESIERGLIYKGKTFIVDSWFISAYQPIYINNEIKGMLFVGVKEIDKRVLKDLFKINTKQDVTFPFLLSLKGEYLIHPTLEGTQTPHNFSKYFKRSSSKINHHDYMSGENDGRIEENLENLDLSHKIGSSLDSKRHELLTDYYKFEKTDQNYIGITLRKDHLLQKLKPFRDKIIWAGSIIIILMFVIITIVVSPLTRRINELVAKVGLMSKGKLVDKVEKVENNEIGSITQSLNVLIDGFRQYANFATKIGEGNLDVDFSALSSDDILGNSLLSMRESLKQSEKERKIRKEENENQKWIAEGLSTFNEILRLHNQDLKKLSYSIVSSLTKYLEANIGGIFILKEESDEYRYLELFASYAYNRERKITKNMSVETGLTGRCILEKKILYFTEIPDDYLKITSGLGHKNPDYLVLIPLIENDDILGLIEIASFNPFSETKQEFIEKVALSISKTISTTKINTRTTNLLEKSQQMSEELAAQEEEMRQNLEELQTTQEASMHRETELTGLLNALHTSTLVIEFDIEGNILNINDSFLSLMRIQREQLIGKNQDILISKNQIPEYRKIRERISKGENVIRTTHFTYLNMDLWLRESYTPINNEEGIPYKFIDIAIDITDSVKQKLIIEEQNKKLSQNKEEIQIKKKKLSNIEIEASRSNAEKSSILKALYESTLIAEFDINGKLMKMNNRMLQLYGISRDDVIGTHHKDFTSMNENTGFYKNFWNDLRQGEIRSVEEYIKLSNGKRFWLSQTYTPILDEDNKPYKVINIATEITSRKIPNV